MDGWLYERITAIEQGIAYLIKKLDEAEKKSKKVKEE